MDRQDIYEWLMNYGWVIIASLIVIGSLSAYFYFDKPATVCETTLHLEFSFNETLMLKQQHMDYEGFKDLFYLPDDIKIECDNKNCSVYVPKTECRLI